MYLDFWSFKMRHQKIGVFLLNKYPNFLTQQNCICFKYNS